MDENFSNLTNDSKMQIQGVLQVPRWKGNTHLYIA